MNKHFDYLIVGGGMAADAAMRGIREVDASGSIGVVGNDPDRPYKRPWLSKALWKGKSIDKVWMPVPDGVEFHLGHNVERIEADENRIRDDKGDIFTYGALLLATGVRPRHVAPNSDRVIAYRTLADYQRLRGLADQGKRFAVVGGGFIGSELAAALTMNEKEVVLIFPGEEIGGHFYPKDLADFISKRYRDKGVDLRTSTRTGKVTEKGDRVIVELVDGDGNSVGELEVDGLVSGIGSELNVELAEQAGLPVEDGVMVDRMLRAGRPNIYAAGDIARFYQSSLDQHIRVEHEDNALKMGKAAGKAMAGAGEPWDYLPFFYSDLFDMGYEAVGKFDSANEIVEDWIEPFGEGVIYYLDGTQVRGVLLWNHWDKVPAARKLIGTDLPEKGEGLRAELLTS